MQIMLTAHEGNDAVVLLKEQVSEMNELQFYNFARCVLPVKWKWDDAMQLVYYIADTNNYLLISYYE